MGVVIWKSSLRSIDSTVFLEGVRVLAYDYGLVFIRCVCVECDGWTQEDISIQSVGKERRLQISLCSVFVFC